MLLDIRSAKEALVLNDLKISLLAAVALTLVASTYARAEILIAVAGPITGQYEWTGEQPQAGQ
jgi:branched-chain amino acid transport system substrate-binding protein